MKIVETDDKLIKCKSCDTTYIYENKDLKLLGPNIYVVECPKCGQRVMMVPEVHLKKVDLPIDIEGEVT